MARTVLIVAIVVSLVLGFLFGFVVSPQPAANLRPRSARVDGMTCTEGAIIGADQDVVVTVEGGGEIITIIVSIDPGFCTYSLTPS